MPHTPTPTNGQCRDLCSCGERCTLSCRVPHTLHVCASGDGACHNHYAGRVSAWLAQHYFSPKYPAAIETYRQWQRNPVALEGPVWVRRNGHEPTD